MDQSLEPAGPGPLDLDGFPPSASAAGGVVGGGVWKTTTRHQTAALDVCVLHGGLELLLSLVFFEVLAVGLRSAHTNVSPVPKMCTWGHGLVLWSHDRAEDYFFVSRRSTGFPGLRGAAACAWKPSTSFSAVLHAELLFPPCRPASWRRPPHAGVKQRLGFNRPDVCAAGFSLLETSAVEAALKGH